MEIIESFKSPVDGARIDVLANGQAIRSNWIGRMLLTEVGGEFIRYLSDEEG
jgi:hypothetical protein